MLIKLKYIIVFLVAFIAEPCDQPKQAGAGEDYGVVKTGIRTNTFNFDKKQVNNTQDENSGFKRKYKSKCTEVATAFIPEPGIIRYCKFTEYTVLIEEKSGTFTHDLHCPERGPPAV